MVRSISMPIFSPVKAAISSANTTGDFLLQKSSKAFRPNKSASKTIPTGGDVFCCRPTVEYCDLF